MDILRTPDACCERLMDYPFAPLWSEVTDPATGQTLRIHRLDEGARTADPVLTAFSDRDPVTSAAELVALIDEFTRK